MANEDIAWLAGLLEGEGSFELSKNSPNTRIPRIRLAMLDKDIVEKAAGFLQSSITTYLTPKRNKTMYRTTIAKKEILIDLLPKLLPYMGERRTLMINKMLAFYGEGVYHR